NEQKKLSNKQNSLDNEQKQFANEQNGFAIDSKFQPPDLRIQSILFIKHSFMNILFFLRAYVPMCLCG
ncbi:MAG TPA: hypothetical protein DCQ31_04590, partial [Bacteroidales bacterium]|nr:hypothetical protein [Bacteroidales bacterium]